MYAYIVILIRSNISIQSSVLNNQFSSQIVRYYVKFDAV
jgi:hypothetical protein